MNWIVETLDHRVDKELEALPRDLKSKFLHIADLLEQFGPSNVREPYVKPLKIKRSLIWEIRMKGQSGIARAAYATLQGNKIIILHAFVKKTQKTPQKAIKTIMERFKEIEK